MCCFQGEATGCGGSKAGTAAPPQAASAPVEIRLGEDKRDLSGHQNPQGSGGSTGRCLLVECLVETVTNSCVPMGLEVKRLVTSWSPQNLLGAVSVPCRSGWAKGARAASPFSLGALKPSLALGSARSDHPWSCSALTPRIPERRTIRQPQSAWSAPPELGSKHGSNGKRSEVGLKTCPCDSSSGWAAERPLWGCADRVWGGAGKQRSPGE
jgi:hypothetical protein